MAECRVRAVEAVPLRFPFDRRLTSALASYGWIDCTLVKVHTDDGPSGVGLTMGVGGAASSAIVPYIEQELAPLVVGQDVLAPEALWARMWAPNKARMRAGIGPWALSAVDIACWDVVGKVAGQPVHTLLGGFANPVPVYGSGGWLSLSDADLVAECQKFAAMGMTAYKLKIGGSRDAERLGLLRREVGDDHGLMVDGNQSYNVREALAVSRMLADFGVLWFEEPVVADSTDDLASVARESAVPIAAGENAYFRWGFREICEHRAAAFLQPDVGRCGGITEFRKVADLASAFGLSLSSHMVHELSISLVGASPSAFSVEYLDLLPADALTRPFPIDGGHIRVPDVPGHGVELTDEAVAKYRWNGTA